MNNEFGADLITLIDDEGVEHEFEILDEIDNDDGVFYALLPTFDDPQSELESEGTYYIFEVIEEDGEDSWQRWRMTSCWISWLPFLRAALKNCTRMKILLNDNFFVKFFYRKLTAGIRGILSSTEITSCLVRGLLHSITLHLFFWELVSPAVNRRPPGMVSAMLEEGMCEPVGRAPTCILP